MKPDPRYRTDQPLPVGTIVLVEYDGTFSSMGNIFHLPLTARVEPIDETTFHGSAIIRILNPRNEQLDQDLCLVQWEVEKLTVLDHPEDFTDRGELEKWLDS